MPYTVTRWVFDTGGAYAYTFARNPDRSGGDSGWKYSSKQSPVPLIGANRDNLQLDGIGSPTRDLKFTGVPGTMMRTLQDFYFRQQVILNCKDHRYSYTSAFNCVIVNFTANWHPSLWDEDVWDIQMTLYKVDKLS